MTRWRFEKDHSCPLPKYPGVKEVVANKQNMKVWCRSWATILSGSVGQGPPFLVEARINGSRLLALADKNV